MTPHGWEDLLTARDEQVVPKTDNDRAGASSEDSRGRGTNPMEPVVDEYRTTTDGVVLADLRIWTTDADVLEREEAEVSAREVAR
jgi:hypothetical protein